MTELAAPPAPEQSQDFDSIVLVGNPNVGKSVIFGYLTGNYVAVSNYPGTTVEIARGPLAKSDRFCSVIDTPGSNSMVPHSEDEAVTRDILLAEESKVVVQIADAKNLDRALFITSQLADMGLRQILVLNLWDEVLDRGIEIDTDALAAHLGIPVVKTIATHRWGLSHIHDALAHAAVARLKVEFPEVIEEAVQAIRAMFPDYLPVSRRAIALMLLSGDESIERRFNLTPETPNGRRSWWKSGNPYSAFTTNRRLVFAQIRAHAVAHIVREVTRNNGRRTTPTLWDRVGQLAMHPAWGVPVLLFVLYAMYFVVGIWGAGDAVGLIENHLFGSPEGPPESYDVTFTVPFREEPVALFTLPFDGINYHLSQGYLALRGEKDFLWEFLFGSAGMISVGLTYALAIVFPVVGFFFLAFGFLEDTGYLPRLAVMLDRIFKTIGMNGKAVLPMVLGLGCDTMATLTTRILDTKKERIIATLLLALAVPCSAQLGVVLGILSSTLPLSGYFLYILIIFSQLVLVGYVSKMIIPGQASDFVLEIPPFRRPKFSNILAKTGFRVQWFLKEAVPYFLVGTFILFVLQYFEILGLLEQATRPVITGVLGLPGDLTKVFIMGFLRRDYGAAGLYDLAMQSDSTLSPVNILVSLVVITLFGPCIANYFIMIKERGAKVASLMVAFILPYAILVGGVLRWTLETVGFGR
ncbi:ferrous iron transporter B [bacterium]|nr:ferrous iron transporter B [bacterium]